MPILEVVISAKLDGVNVDGFPILKRLEVTEAQTVNIQKTGVDGAAVALPTVDYLATVNAVILKNDAALSVLLNNGTIIAMNAGGVILVLDGTINAGAATNVKVQNLVATSAGVRGLVGGA